MVYDIYFCNNNNIRDKNTLSCCNDNNVRDDDTLSHCNDIAIQNEDALFLEYEDLYEFFI